MDKELVNLLVSRRVMYHNYEEENIIIKNQTTIMILAIRESFHLYTDILMIKLLSLLILHRYNEFMGFKTKENKIISRIKNYLGLK